MKMYPDDKREYVPVQLTDITHAVSRHFDIPVKTIKSLSRLKRILLARQMVMYIAYKTGQWSYQSIGKEFGKTHATVLNSCSSIRGRLAADRSLNAHLKTITEKLFPHRSAGARKFRKEESVERTITSMAAEMVELDHRRKELKNEMSLISGEISSLTEEMLPLMQSENLQRLTLHGKTVFLRRQLWASAARTMDTETGEEVADTERAIAALKDAGMDHMVKETFSTQSLSAWARELPEDDNMMPILPPELDGAIRLTEKFDVRVVKASSK